MWFALDAGGPLGVVAVRLADSIPAIVFGLHGGVAADRWSRRRLMIGSDLVRGVVLIPVAIAGLAGGLPLWGLVVASFVLEAATSYFEPAYGATVPTLVDRDNVQQANALVQATAQALSIGGWAIAAAFLTFMPVSVFFAVNSVSFLISAALIARIRSGHERDPTRGPPRIREGFAALRPYPMLAAWVIALGVAVTITAGTWIGGVPTLVRDTLHHGAGGFSIIMAGYAAGSIVAGVFLARVRIRHKARARDARMVDVPARVWPPRTGNVAPARRRGSVLRRDRPELVRRARQLGCAGAGAGSVLGRVLGVISLTHRGAHATGLLLVSPLFAFVARTRSVRRGGDRGAARRARRARRRDARDQSSSSLTSSTCARVEPVDPQQRTRRGGGCACRHQADELGPHHLRPTRRGLRLDAADDLVQRGCLPVLDVHRDLDDTRARQIETERANAGEAAPALAHDARDLPRDGELASEIDVERDQRPARADEHGAGGLVQPRRPVVGRQLARVDARLEPCGAAAPEVGGPPLGWRVHEHRHAASAASRRAIASAARSARAMSSGTSGTIGTTSAAPTRGCAPSCVRRSMRSRATVTAAERASASSTSWPTSVKTERL